MTAGQQDPNLYTLTHVLGHFPEVDEVTRRRMYEALVDREDQIVEVLHLAGVQFGLFPQIVAEVLAEVGLGTPKSETERAMIRRSFTELMAAIQRAQTGDGPMPTP
jgi:hypothetical protein